MTSREPLIDAIARLSVAFEVSGFPHAIIGAFGRNAWARPRATTDADFAVAVAPARVEEVRALITATGFAIRKERNDPSGDGVPELLLLVDAHDPRVRVDLLVAHTPFEDDVLARRVRARVGDVDVWVATAEDMVVYKLVAGRPRDYVDAEDIVRGRLAAGVELDWAHVERWLRAFDLASRATDLRALVDDDQGS